MSATRSRAVRRVLLGAAILLSAVLLPGLLFVVSASPASGQDGCAGAGESVEMRMLLEKTIFRVDVLTLNVGIQGPAASRIREIRRRRSSTPAVRDSVARIAAHATCADARLVFHRDVSLEQFLDGIRSSAREAMEAGYIGRDTYRLIDRFLPQWYAFLQGRGIREGDRMSYRIRGDTLGIGYRSGEGELLLERTDVGAERRRSVLAGYFAPGSDFREGLIRSLFRSDGRAGVLEEEKTKMTGGRR